MDNIEETKKDYEPNKFSLFQLIWNSLFSFGILSYGTVGLLLDDLYLPGKRTSGRHFHGEPLWILYLSCLSIVVNLLAVVLDHYDERDNEHKYKKLTKITYFMSWVFFILALVIDLFIFKKSSKY